MKQLKQHTYFLSGRVGVGTVYCIRTKDTLLDSEGKKHICFILHCIPVLIRVWHIVNAKTNVV